MHDLIAVFDVGKTNTKLSVIESSNAAVVYTAQRANRSLRALGMNQLDLVGMETWLIETLSHLPEKARISAMVPVGHGAACVLLDAKGRVLVAPDYEDPCFNETAAAYALLRDPFAQTRSPRLPDGQNLGAQLFNLESRHSAVFSQATRILLLPQYWAWRLSAVAASEVSSLGAHSDLWRPERGGFSTLARQRGWCERFPPMRAASDVLGPLAQEIVATTGLPAACEVLCGVHDSNASWLSHRWRARAGASLTVISSGTWTIAMKSGADLERLREDRDMLANVDVFGSPVATARFMGGREYAAIAGSDPATPTVNDLQRVIALGAMALPSFAEAGGPFQGRAGRIDGAQGLTPGERAALACLYVALVTEVMLDFLGDSELVVVDGPLAENPLYSGLLQTLRPTATVVVSARATGATAGALALVLGGNASDGVIPNDRIKTLAMAGLSGYRDAWRMQVGLV